MLWYRVLKELWNLNDNQWSIKKEKRKTKVNLVIIIIIMFLKNLVHVPLSDRKVCSYIYIYIL